MKHITLLLATLLATQIAFAQDEVAIEQNINQPIHALVINPGWNVQLIQSQGADSSYRIAIITEEALSAFAYNVQLCSVKGDTLTILENTQLPKGTVVELEGPMTYRQISMMPGAVVSADRIITSKAVVPKFIYLGRDANCNIQHLQIPDEESSFGVDIWDHAQLTIDTISGEGNAVVNVYEDAKFQYNINTLCGKITLYDYEIAHNWPYWQKDVREIKTKEVDGELVTTNRHKIWTDALSLDAGIGILQGNTPTDPNSPLLQSTTVSVKLGLTTYFKFSNRWWLNTGILWNHNTKSLCHQVKYENNELQVIDGQGDFQRDRLKNDYLGIPVTLYYYLGQHHTESISLDLYCARLLGERLSTSANPNLSWGLGWTAISVDNIFNPWKLEAGLSFNTQHLGFIHGIRVFTNLLPEYKPGITTDKIRSVGIEIKL